MDQQFSNVAKPVFTYMLGYLDMQNKKNLKKTCKKFNDWVKFSDKDFSVKYWNDINKLKKNINQLKNQCRCDRCEICSKLFCFDCESNDKYFKSKKCICGGLVCYSCANFDSKMVQCKCLKWCYVNCTDAKKCICGEIFCIDCKNNSIKCICGKTFCNSCIEYYTTLCSCDKIYCNECEYKIINCCGYIKYKSTCLCNDDYCDDCNDKLVAYSKNKIKIEIKNH